MRNYSAAAGDLTAGFRRWDIWLTLAWLDIKLRYRRTLIGPFWMALTSIVSVGIMGLVYSRLFRMNMREYFPYLACGMALWSLIASLTNEAPAVFVNAAHLARQTPLPYSIHVLRRVANSVLQFLHTWVSFWCVALCFGVPVGFRTLGVVPGLAMLCLFGYWLTLLVGTICLRYRDLGQAMTIATQILVLITPIFWHKRNLTDANWIVACNPVFHLLEICRAPLLGQPVPWNSWLIVLAINATGCLVAFVLFAQYRKRIAYWM
jgi:ABC-type polysaccharide/polyol phosphate export permease